MGANRIPERETGSPVRAGSRNARVRDVQHGAPALLALQRSAGNAAVTSWLQRDPSAPQSPAGVPAGERAKIDKALGPSGTANDAKDIASFGAASEPEKVKLIQLLMTDLWVGPTGESAIERCWGSVPDERFVAFAGDHKKLWDDSIDRGAELESLRQYRDIKTSFRNDVLAVATGHLTTNAGVVQSELRKFGIPEKEGAAASGPTPDQAAELAKLIEAAKTLKALQVSREKTRNTVVGWRIGDASEQEPDAHGKVKFKVLFDPKSKPAMEENPSPDLLAADHWGPVVPYELLKPAYDAASKSMARIMASYPSLYALGRQDQSAVTAAVADETDPKIAQKKLGDALRLLDRDIVDTKGKLGKDIDAMDLAPIHEQLFGGVAPAAGARWQAGFRQDVAKAAIREHKSNKALVDALLQSGVHIAFLLAPFTGGLTLVALMTAATAATGYKALVSADEYAALDKASKTAVTPETRLVDDQTVEHAKMVADADAAALALSAIALGGAIAGFVGGAPTAMNLRPQTRFLRVADPKLLAEYEQLATRKMPAIVAEVLEGEGTTVGRTRLAQLRVEFDQLRSEVGSATQLTEAQRARANQILGEARTLARADFKNLQTKVTKRLRADPELKQLEDRLIAAGDVEDKATGGVRLKTQKADGSTNFEPVNIEHRTRLSDNPWAAKDAENLLLTDAAQNQQYLEAIRQYGGVWPADAIEDFVVRHQLNNQGIDFRPGPR